MLVKAQLVSKIAEIIQRRSLTRVEAAELPGLTQPKVSAMLRGQVQGQEPPRSHAVPRKWAAAGLPPNQARRA
ncbi:MAG: helix-turn-helix domain-containing protein [Burkholderiales bacterium]|nr:helix-turn-helix domain-containing protein [Burkholderiales bacterium]